MLFSISLQSAVGIRVKTVKTDAMTGFIQTWTGEAEAHECDSLGHLNMRHYLYKAQQARQMFIIKLGLPNAFKAGHPSSVKFMNAHIQYKAESRPGQLLYIETGLLELRDIGMTLLHVIYHVNGTVSATIIENIEHVYLPTGASFDWPLRVKTAALQYQIDMPNYAAPRSLNPWPKMVPPTQAELEKWGIKQIGQGVFQRAETDMFDRVMGGAILGRASDCVAHYKEGWPEAHKDAAFDDKTMGILLEVNFVCHRPVRAGQAFSFYSGIGHVNRRTRRLIHTLIDPTNGVALASMDAVSALFDLQSRKILEPSAQNLETLQAACTPELIRAIG